MFKASGEAIKVLSDGLLDIVDGSHKSVDRILIARRVSAMLSWPNSRDNARDTLFDALAKVGPIKLQHSRYFMLSYGGPATVMALNPNNGIITRVVRAFDVEDLRDRLLRTQIDSSVSGGVESVAEQDDYDLVVAELEYARDNPWQINASQ